MKRPFKKLGRVLNPQPAEKAWFDLIMLVVFGAWLYSAAAQPWLPLHPQLDMYSCAGPGFVDFGCTGGQEAIIANIVHALFTLFLLAVVIIAVARLTNRRKGGNNA
jgi:hypothetical protein